MADAPGRRRLVRRPLPHRRHHRHRLSAEPSRASAVGVVEESHKLLVQQMDATLVTIAREADEIGAGHTVPVLYGIGPIGVPVRGDMDPLKYQAPPATPAPAAAAAKGDATRTSQELLTLKLRYPASDGNQSKLTELPVTDRGAKFARASGDCPFASAIAAFGLALKDSACKGSATLDTARERAQEGNAPAPPGYRAEFINLLDKIKALKR